MTRFQLLLNQLRRTQELHEAEAGIDDAILSRHFSPYAWKRLRNILFSQAGVIAVHCLEFLLLRSIFRSHHLVGLIFFQTLFSLLISFWWGYLEHFRSEVHRYYRLGLRHELSEWISGWNGLARLGSYFILLSGAGVIFHLAGGYIARAGAMEFAVATLFIRAAFEFQMRFRNSIVFSLRRVYRPTWVTLTIEISVLLITFLTVGAIGPNAFALGNLVGLGISGAVASYYNQIAIRGLKLPPFSRVGKIAAGLEFQKKSFRQQVLSGFAMVSTRIGSLVVLLSFASPERVPLFHVISPVLAASSFWVQTFHFDLRRYSGPTFEGVRRDLQGKILRSSFVVAAILWVLALASLQATGFAQSAFAIVFLGIILLLRSWVAGLSLVRFVHRSYGVVVLSGILLIVGILNIHWVLFRIPQVVTGRWNLWGAELCAFTVVYILSMLPLFFVWNHRWLHTVSGLLGSLEFSEYLRANLGRAQSMKWSIPNRRLVYYRCLAFATRHNLVVYRENAKTLWVAGVADPESIRIQLLTEMSGWIDRFQVLDFNAGFVKSQPDDLDAQLRTLRQEFIHRFPDQAYWIAGEPIHAPQASRALMRDWFKQVCMTLDYVKLRKMDWDIVPVMNNGQLSAFFVMNKARVAFAERQEFRTRVESFQADADSAFQARRGLTPSNA